MSELPDAAPDLRTLIENLPGNIVRRVLHPDGRFTYAYLSRGLRETFRIDPEAITAQGDADFGWIAPEDRQAFRDALHASARRLTTLDVENRVIGADGAVRWVRSIARPRRQPDGTVVWDGVALDATEKRRAEAEMLAAVARAERADAAKSRFLAAASHDLRQPLQAMRFHLAALETQVATAAARRTLDDLSQCVDVMHGLLGSLLDVSRLDAGVVRPQPQPVALADLAGAVAREIAPEAAACDVALAVDCRGAVAVDIDATLFGSVLRNLAQNAVKHGRRGGRARLRLRPYRGRLVATVADDGFGIDHADHARVFEPFAQFGEAARDRSRGLGLGLAIVERTVRLLDGMIRLRSAQGRGAVFRVSVPAPVTSHPTVMSDNAAPSGVSLAGRRILVLEDDTEVADALVGLLHRWGCEAQAVSEPDAFRDAALASPPDAAIADIRLGGLETGLDALLAVRSLQPTLAALLLTGETDPARLRSLVTAGVPVLHKPVQAARLRAALAGVLAGGTS